MEMCSGGQSGKETNNWNFSLVCNMYLYVFSC
jgi:hypothetical protein